MNSVPAWPTELVPGQQGLGCDPPSMCDRLTLIPRSSVGEGMSKKVEAGKSEFKASFVWIPSCKLVGAK